MNKKIMVFCLAVLALVVLSGCSEFPISCEPQQEFCASKGMSYKCGNHKGKTFWCKDHHGNKIPYTLEEFNNFNINKYHIREYHYHKHEEHPKIEHHHDKKKSCQKEMYLDDEKYPACKNWCNNEGYDGEYSYEYMCHYNCARERTVCTT